LLSSGVNSRLPVFGGYCALPAQGSRSASARIGAAAPIGTKTASRGKQIQHLPEGFVSYGLTFGGAAHRSRRPCWRLFLLLAWQQQSSQGDSRTAKEASVSRCCERWTSLRANGVAEAFRPHFDMALARTVRYELVRIESMPCRRFVGTMDTHCVYRSRVHIGDIAMSVTVGVLRQHDVCQGAPVILQAGFGVLNRTAAQPVWDTTHQCRYLLSAAKITP
jgi:hypothetical protein